MKKLGKLDSLRKIITQLALIPIGIEPLRNSSPKISNKLNN